MDFSAHYPCPYEFTDPVNNNERACKDSAQAPHPTKERPSETENTCTYPRLTGFTTGSIRPSPPNSYSRPVNTPGSSPPRGLSGGASPPTGLSTTGLSPRAWSTGSNEIQVQLARVQKLEKGMREVREALERHLLSNDVGAELKQVYVPSAPVLSVLWSPVQGETGSCAHAAAGGGWWSEKLDRSIQAEQSGLRLRVCDPQGHPPGTLDPRPTAAQVQGDAADEVPLGDALGLNPDAEITPPAVRDYLFARFQDEVLPLRYQLRAEESKHAADTKLEKLPPTSSPVNNEDGLASARIKLQPAVYGRASSPSIKAFQGQSEQTAPKAGGQVDLEDCGEGDLEGGEGSGRLRGWSSDTDAEVAGRLLLRRARDQ